MLGVRFLWCLVGSARQGAEEKFRCRLVSRKPVSFVFKSCAALICKCADHGGPRWTTWPTTLPNTKEASAETCAPTTGRRSILASGQRGAQGAHRVSKSHSPGPRTQFQNDETAPISPIDARITHQHHRRPMHGQFSRQHTDQLQCITHCAPRLNRF